MADAQSHGQMPNPKPSKFLTLPRELTDKIYSHLLLGPYDSDSGTTIIRLQKHHRINRLYMHEAPTPIHASILRVCKRFHAEGVATLYGRNTFVFQLRCGITDLRNFAAQVGGANLGMVRYAGIRTLVGWARDVMAYHEAGMETRWRYPGDYAECVGMCRLVGRMTGLRHLDLWAADVRCYVHTKYRKVYMFDRKEERDSEGDRNGEDDYYLKGWTLVGKYKAGAFVWYEPKTRRLFVEGRSGA